MKIDHSKNTIIDAFGVTEEEIHAIGGEFIKALGTYPKFSEALEKYFGEGHDREFWLRILGFKRAVEFLNSPPPNIMIELGGIFKTAGEPNKPIFDEFGNQIGGKDGSKE